MAGQLIKETKVSIFSVTNGVGDGFHPAWRGASGEELADCPFSFDEKLNECLRTSACRASGAKAYAGAALQGVDLSEQELAKTDFSSANLRMADCSRAVLSESAFRFADLTYADFDLADLSRADFFRADLCKASLRGARLELASFVGADLEHADFLEADLRGADFTDTDARNAHFAGALFDARTVLPFSIEEARRLGMIESPLVDQSSQGRSAQ